MTKQQIAKELERRANLTNLQARDAIEAFMDIITDALVKDDTILLRGFGCFKTVRRAPKPARNIRKGTTVWLPARREVKFMPYNQLKELVNLNDRNEKANIDRNEKGTI